MSSKISVVIPVYNVGPFLAETIRSALAQTRAADEILIVDDCSTDDSLTIARTFNDPRCRVLSTGKNSGSAVGRNLGIDNSTGDLIAFLDGDDVWLPQHLEIVAGLLDTHPTASLAFSSTEAFGCEHWIWPMVIPENEPVDCFWQCIPKTIIPQMNVIVRRSALVEVGSYRATMRQTQDFDLFLRLAYHHPFVCTHAVTTGYRRHETSITWLKPKNSMRGQYVSRHLFWLENKATMKPEILTRYEMAMREVWANHMTACARRLDLDMLNFHMSQFPMIPGSAEPYRLWRRQWRVDRIKPIWALLPMSLRGLLKKMFRSLGLQQDPVAVAPVTFTPSPSPVLTQVKHDDVSI